MTTSQIIMTLVVYAIATTGLAGYALGKLSGRRN
jgi:hypothetical protein